MLTRDDIIRMMDWHPSFDRNQTDGLLARIERVAQAAAAAERERMIADGWRQCAQGQRTSQFCAVAEQARQEEREACAQECDAVSESANKAAVAGQYLIIRNGAEARRCSAAIRARSKT